VAIMLKTERLILRPWKEEDLEPFATLNANPAVMEFYPSTLSREQSDHYAHRVMQLYEENGWGLWAVSLPGVAEFIGYVGLLPVNPQMPFAPAIEIGWRLDKNFWGKGYASEAAQEVLNYSFEVLDFDEIVSFTTVQNLRSRRVMEKIGMTHDPKDDFNHPYLPLDDRLSQHVLYRISNTSAK